jgi:hypothetical protein
MSAATTSERPVSRTHEEILKEAARIEEAALLTSKAHFKASEMWGWFHIALGLPTVVIAGLTGAVAFARLDSTGLWAGYLSIAVVVLSSITTFLDPNKRASGHLTAGNKYDALLNKVRIFRTIECWEEQPDQVLSDRLKRHSEDKSTLNRSCPQVSFIAYHLAKRGIRRGEGEYAVDKQAGGTTPAQPG